MAALSKYGMGYCNGKARICHDEWDKFQQIKNKKEKRKKNRMSGSI